MTSILTNTAAMNALQALSVTQRGLARTQERVATGLAVATASDNAAYWSMSVRMRSQISALSSIGDGLDLTSSLLQTATAGLHTIKTALDAMHNDVLQAGQPGLSLTALDQDIAAQEQIILTTARSGSFGGQNLIVSSESNPPNFFYGDPAAESTPASLSTSIAVPNFNLVGDAALGTGGLLTTLAMYSPAGNQISRSPSERNGYTSTTQLTLLHADATDLATFRYEIEFATSAVIADATAVGSAETEALNMRSFDMALSTALTSGVGALVDADMNVASTRLQALQTQQQLGIQALSIANQDGQLVLKLFGQA